MEASLYGRLKGTKSRKWMVTNTRGGIRLQPQNLTLFPNISTVTPVWKVEAGVPQVIHLPCNWDVVHFTLETNRTATPKLTVGDATFFLDPLTTSQPRLILTLKRNHTPTPRMVSLKSSVLDY